MQAPSLKQIKACFTSGTDNEKKNCLRVLGPQLSSSNNALKPAEKKKYVYEIIIVLISSKNAEVQESAFWSLTQATGAEFDDKMISDVIDCLDLSCQDSKSVGKCYEACNFLQRITKEKKHNLEGHTKIIAAYLLKTIVHPVTRIREASLPSFQEFYPLLLKHQPHLAAYFSSLIVSGSFIKDCLHLSNTQNSYVSKVINYILPLLGKELWSGRSVLKLFLPIIEKGFKVRNGEELKAAFVVWKTLIELISEDLDALIDPRRMKFIMQPVRIKVQRYPIALPAFQDAFWTLIIRLRHKLPPHFESLFMPLLERILDCSLEEMNTMVSPPLIKSETNLPMIQLACQMLLRVLDVPVNQSCKELGARKEKLIFTVPELEIPLPVSIVLHNFKKLVRASRHVMMACGKNEENAPMLETLFTSLLHVASFAPDKTNNFSVDAVSSLLSLTEKVITKEVLHPNLCLKYLQHFTKLPSHILASHYCHLGHNTVMHNNLALSLVTLLLKPYIFVPLRKEASFRAAFKHLLNTNILETQSSLIYAQMFLKLMEEKKFTAVADSEDLLVMWCDIVTPLLALVKKLASGRTRRTRLAQSQEASQVDSLENDFSCVYSILLYPTQLLPPTEERFKPILKFWSELYTLLIEHAPSVEKNAVCEEFCEKLKMSVKQDFLQNELYFGVICSMLKVIIDCVDFEYVSQKEGSLDSNNSQGNYNKKKPLGNMTAVINLIVLLLQSSHENISVYESRHTERQKKTMFETPELSKCAMLFNSVESFFDDIRNYNLIPSLMSNIAKPLNMLFLLSHEDKGSDSQLSAQLKDLWENISLVIIHHYDGPYDVKFLQILGPIFESTYDHACPDIVNISKKLWSTTFAFDQSSLKYTKTAKISSSTAWIKKFSCAKKEMETEDHESLKDDVSCIAKEKSEVLESSQMTSPVCDNTHSAESKEDTVSNENNFSEADFELWPETCPDESSVIEQSVLNDPKTEEVSFVKPEKPSLKYEKNKSEVIQETMNNSVLPNANATASFCFNMTLDVTSNENNLLNLTKDLSLMEGAECNFSQSPSLKSKKNISYSFRRTRSKLRAKTSHLVDESGIVEDSEDKSHLNLKELATQTVKEASMLHITENTAVNKLDVAEKASPSEISEPSLPDSPKHRSISPVKKLPKDSTDTHSKAEILNYASKSGSCHKLNDSKELGIINLQETVKVLKPMVTIAYTDEIRQKSNLSPISDDKIKSVQSSSAAGSRSEASSSPERHKQIKIVGRDKDKNDAPNASVEDAEMRKDVMFNSILKGSNKKNEELSIKDDQINIEEDQINNKDGQISIKDNEINDKDLNIKKDELDIKKDKLDIKKDELNIKKDKLDIKKDELDIKKDELSIKESQFNVKDDEFNVKNDELNIKDDQVCFKDDQQFSIIDDEQINVKNDQVNVTDDELSNSKSLIIESTEHMINEHNYFQTPTQKKPERKSVSSLGRSRSPKKLQMSPSGEGREEARVQGYQLSVDEQIMALPVKSSSLSASPPKSVTDDSSVEVTHVFSKTDSPDKNTLCRQEKLSQNELDSSSQEIFSNESCDNASQSSIESDVNEIRNDVLSSSRNENDTEINSPPSTAVSSSSTRSLRNVRKSYSSFRFLDTERSPSERCKRKSNIHSNGSSSSDDQIKPSPELKKINETQLQIEKRHFASMLELKNCESVQIEEDKVKEQAIPSDEEIVSVRSDLTSEASILCDKALALNPENVSEQSSMNTQSPIEHFNDLLGSSENPIELLSDTEDILPSSQFVSDNSVTIYRSKKNLTDEGAKEKLIQVASEEQPSEICKTIPPTLQVLEDNASSIDVSNRELSDTMNNEKQELCILAESKEICKVSEDTLSASQEKRNVAAISKDEFSENIAEQSINHLNENVDTTVVPETLTVGSSQAVVQPTLPKTVKTRSSSRIKANENKLNSEVSEFNRKLHHKKKANDAAISNGGEMPNTALETALAGNAPQIDVNNEIVSETSNALDAFETTKPEDLTVDAALPQKEVMSNITELETSEKNSAFPQKEVMSNITELETSEKNSAFPQKEVMSNITELETSEKNSAFPQKEVMSNITELETSEKNSAFPQKESVIDEIKHSSQSIKNTEVPNFLEANNVQDTVTNSQTSDDQGQDSQDSTSNLDSQASTSKIVLGKRRKKRKPFIPRKNKNQPKQKSEICHELNTDVPSIDPTEPFQCFFQSTLPFIVEEPLTDNKLSTVVEEIPSHHSSSSVSVPNCKLSVSEKLLKKTADSDVEEISKSHEIVANSPSSTQISSNTSKNAIVEKSEIEKKDSDEIQPILKTETSILSSDKPSAEIKIIPTIPAKITRTRKRSEAQAEKVNKLKAELRLSTTKKVRKIKGLNAIKNAKTRGEKSNVDVNLEMSSNSTKRDVVITDEIHNENDEPNNPLCDVDTEKEQVIPKNQTEIVSHPEPETITPTMSIKISETHKPSETQTENVKEARAKSKVSRTTKKTRKAKDLDIVKNNTMISSGKSNVGASLEQTLDCTKHDITVDDEIHNKDSDRANNTLDDMDVEKEQVIPKNGTTVVVHHESKTVPPTVPIRSTRTRKHSETQLENINKAKAELKVSRTTQKLRKAKDLNTFKNSTVINNEKSSIDVSLEKSLNCAKQDITVDEIHNKDSDIRNSTHGDMDVEKEQFISKSGMAIVVNPESETVIPTVPIKISKTHEHSETQPENINEAKTEFKVSRTTQNVRKAKDSTVKNSTIINNEKSSIDVSLEKSLNCAKRDVTVDEMHNKDSNISDSALGDMDVEKEQVIPKSGMAIVVNSESETVTPTVPIKIAQIHEDSKTQPENINEAKAEFEVSQTTQNVKKVEDSTIKNNTLINNEKASIDVNLEQSLNCIKHDIPVDEIRNKDSDRPNNTDITVDEIHNKDSDRLNNTLGDMDVEKEQVIPKNGTTIVVHPESKTVALTMPIRITRARKQAEIKVPQTTQSLRNAKDNTVKKSTTINNEKSSIDVNLEMSSNSTKRDLTITDEIHNENDGPNNPLCNVDTEKEQVIPKNQTEIVGHPKPETITPTMSIKISETRKPSETQTENVKEAKSKSKVSRTTKKPRKAKGLDTVKNNTMICSEKSTTGVNLGQTLDCTKHDITVTNEICDKDSDRPSSALDDMNVEKEKVIPKNGIAIVVHPESETVAPTVPIRISRTRKHPETQEKNMNKTKKFKVSQTTKKLRKPIGLNTVKNSTMINNEKSRINVSLEMSLNCSKHDITVDDEIHNKDGQAHNTLGDINIEKEQVSPKKLLIVVHPESASAQDSIDIGNANSAKQGSLIQNTLGASTKHLHTDSQKSATLNNELSNSQPTVSKVPRKGGVLTRRKTRSAKSNLKLTGKSDNVSPVAAPVTIQECEQSIITFTTLEGTAHNDPSKLSQMPKVTTNSDSLLNTNENTAIHNDSVSKLDKKPDETSINHDPVTKLNNEKPEGITINDDSITRLDNEQPEEIVTSIVPIPELDGGKLEETTLSNDLISKLEDGKSGEYSMNNGLIAEFNNGKVIGTTIKSDSVLKLDNEKTEEFSINKESIAELNSEKLEETTIKRDSISELDDEKSEEFSTKNDLISELDDGKPEEDDINSNSISKLDNEKLEEFSTNSDLIAELDGEKPKETNIISNSFSKLGNEKPEKFSTNNDLIAELDGEKPEETNIISNLIAKLDNEKPEELSTHNDLLPELDGGKLDETNIINNSTSKLDNEKPEVLSMNSEPIAELNGEKIEKNTISSSSISKLHDGNPKGVSKSNDVIPELNDEMLENTPLNVDFLLKLDQNSGKTCITDNSTLKLSQKSTECSGSSNNNSQLTICKSSLDADENSSSNSSDDILPNSQLPSDNTLKIYTSKKELVGKIDTKNMDSCIDKLAINTSKKKSCSSQLIFLSAASNKVLKTHNHSEIEKENDSTLNAEILCPETEALEEISKESHSVLENAMPNSTETQNNTLDISSEETESCVELRVDCVDNKLNNDSQEVIITSCDFEPQDSMRNQPPDKTNCSSDVVLITIDSEPSNELDENNSQCIIISETPDDRIPESQESTISLDTQSGILKKRKRKDSSQKNKNQPKQKISKFPNETALAHSQILSTVVESSEQHASSLIPIEGKTSTCNDSVKEYDVSTNKCFQNQEISKLLLGKNLEIIPIGSINEMHDSKMLLNSQSLSKNKLNICAVENILAEKKDNTSDAHFVTTTCLKNVQLTETSANESMNVESALACEVPQTYASVENEKHAVIDIQMLDAEKESTSNKVVDAAKLYNTPPCNTEEVISDPHTKAASSPHKLPADLIINNDCIKPKRSSKLSDFVKETSVFERKPPLKRLHLKSDKNMFGVEIPSSLEMSILCTNETNLESCDMHFEESEDVENNSGVKVSNVQMVTGKRRRKKFVNTNKKNKTQPNQKNLMKDSGKDQFTKNNHREPTVIRPTLSLQPSVLHFAVPDKNSMNLLLATHGINVSAKNSGNERHGNVPMKNFHREDVKKVCDSNKSELLCSTPSYISNASSLVHENSIRSPTSRGSNKAHTTHKKSPLLSLKRSPASRSEAMLQAAQSKRLCLEETAKDAKGLSAGMMLEELRKRTLSSTPKSSKIQPRAVRTSNVASELFPKTDSTAIKSILKKCDPKQKNGVFSQKKESKKVHFSEPSPEEKYQSPNGRQYFSERIKLAKEKRLYRKSAKLAIAAKKESTNQSESIISNAQCTAVVLEMCSEISTKLDSPIVPIPSTSEVQQEDSSITDSSASSRNEPIEIAAKTPLATSHDECEAGPSSPADVRKDDDEKSNFKRKLDQMLDSPYLSKMDVFTLMKWNEKLYKHIKIIVARELAK